LIFGFKEISDYRLRSRRRVFPDNSRVFSISDGYDRSDEPIASPMQGLDEARIGGRIPQDLAEFVQGRAQTVIEIDECIFWPKRAPQFLPSDQLSLLLKQRN
jgi:hypothetical protein